ncbi:MAG: hypothetical protein ABIJ21_00210 [Nanoarchaeota archaeon]
MAKKIITICNAGKERSRILAASLDELLSKSGWEVVARGTYGLIDDNKGVPIKYGWVPPRGFVDLMKREISYPNYPSQMLSEKEAEEAKYIIAMDSTVAERAKKKFPKHAHKVILALEAVKEEDNPFDPYLGKDIPDAWGGHLSKKVWKCLQDKDPEQRVRKLEREFGSLDSEIRDYARNYDGGSPTEIMKIPKQLREYMGHNIDTDEAYLEEAKLLKKVARALHQKGYFK